MLFLLLALVSAVFTFGGMAGAFVGIAKLLFFVFVVLFLISAVSGTVRGRPPI
jgi:uncharacterized membrane protein YtjA (UPF0391 family)